MPPTTPGRCHDQGSALGFVGAPQGGLEIADVTNLGKPEEIGLTSHIGESHTVNVDPKRPHIAYSVTSDAVTLDPATGQRNNEKDETPPNPQRFNLDGFEVVDLSSCMNFPAGTSRDAKRAACRPEVSRYRYPTVEMAPGHSVKSRSDITDQVFGCYELEIYADDRLTCGSGGALIVLDVKDAFDDNGTPTDFSDDKPKGKPLDCSVRPSSTLAPPLKSGPMVTDCVKGGPAGAKDLTVPAWLADGAPSLEGVRYVGSVHHAGRASTVGAFETFPATEDVDFDHEAEYSASRNFLLATDERSGGVTPPGATCSTGVDNPQGNGRCQFLPRRRPLDHGAGDEGRGSSGVRKDVDGPEGHLPGSHQNGGGRHVLHGPHVPADSGPESDLHGVVQARDAGRRLHRERQRDGGLQGGCVLHPGRCEQMPARRASLSAPPRRVRAAAGCRSASPAAAAAA